MSQAVSDQVFDFDQTYAEDRQLQKANSGKQSQAGVAIDLGEALQSAGEAAYRWDIATDQITWSANAAHVLGCAPESINTGKLFANMMDVENVTSRYEAVMNSKERDDGAGVSFQIEYLFRSNGRKDRKAIWIEDIGRWRAGADGLPKVVFGVLRCNDERHNRDQHLTYLGNCDPLTGMMNRGRLIEAMGEALAVATRNSSKCAFAIAAINNLALVNEAYGFDVADEVIVCVGRKLRQVMRVGDGIARYSGGKFGIILNDCKGTELETALQRYLSIIRDAVIETTKGPVWATLSIGAIVMPDQAYNPQMATSLAEDALNEARKRVSDAYVIFKPSERRQAERVLNARCATEIVNCLKEGRFELAYQPIVDSKTRIPYEHEALLRMREANGELIAATHLVPVAERLGLVRLVDRAVMQMIIQALHAHSDAKLSMNVSGTTATDPHWYNQILDVITSNADAAKRLTIEITETVALNDLGATRLFIERLRNAGCSVAIDDFGAGYTSFRNLRELPVTTLKIDGSFCRNLAQNSDNEYLVRGLIDLSSKFKLKTVAEWIETDEDAQLLTSWGVDYLQGNLLGAAKVELPWARTSQGMFVVDGEAPMKTPMITVPMPELEVVEAKEVFERTEVLPFESEAVVSETIANDMSSSPIAEAASLVLEGEMQMLVSEPEPEPPLAAILDFAEIDDSIARLRSALFELSSAGKDSQTQEAA